MRAIASDPKALCEHARATRRALPRRRMHARSTSAGRPERSSRTYTQVPLPASAYLSRPGWRSNVCDKANQTSESDVGFCKSTTTPEARVGAVRRRERPCHESHASRNAERHATRADRRSSRLRSVVPRLRCVAMEETDRRSYRTNRVDGSSSWQLTHF